MYGALASFALTAVTRGPTPISLPIAEFIVFVLSGAALASALVIIDRKTIANFKRTITVVLSGEILWLISLGFGTLYAWLTKASGAVGNSLIFGAFACAGLEFLIINGTFTGKASYSLLLAGLYPASTLLVVSPAVFTGSLDAVSLVFSVIAFLVILGFTLSLRRKKTSKGYDALTLFHAFMKTWASGEPSELERIILDHSEEAEVTTQVLRLHTSGGDTFIILPGVHPGPFHPVGSYDLPGVVAKAFKDLGPVMTLHRPGGHERNLATSEQTLRFATELSEFARTLTPAVGDSMARGPVYSKIGLANASSTAFSDHLILTISFAPLGSDDLSAAVERDLGAMGSRAGFDLSVVDAHNSIDHTQESPDVKDNGWSILFERTRSISPESIRTAYSHSSAFSFVGGKDLTENGLGLLMIESGGTKSVLVLADANNAVSSLRASTMGALDESGYKLIEFCTSDSHNLAARGLTVARGYKALGEETPVDSLVKLVVEMAKSAETKLSSASFGFGEMTSKVRVFGSKALEEFADITQKSSKLGRDYLKFAVVSTVALFLLALIS